MIPETILFEQIAIGDRGRTTYDRIEELSQSIFDNGLIQPVVLVPLENGNYGLDAGGRRFKALQMLGHKVLYHATTCESERPGFVLKGEDQATPLKRLFTEIAENLDRESLEWRDEIALLKKAWTLSKHQADSNGEQILMRDFGSSLGVGYSHLQAAVTVHDDVIANPDRYKDCTGVRAAYSILLKHNAQELTKLSALKSIDVQPLKVSQVVLTEGTTEVAAQIEPKLEITIPLTNFFHNNNALHFMAGLGPDQFDHIITDPDYGVSVDRLEASLTTANHGVHQKTIEESLDDMDKLMRLAWRTVKPQGFLVFWYDLDHHEKLQNMATGVGWAVQRWPLIWHKTDYRSNAAPQFNFTKNIEYAMVCRKPTAVLARAQNSSVYACPTGTITRELGHPFAKPYEVWHWIFNAICLKGQNFYDPFVGRGSSSIAGVKWGLRPVGSETDPDHYHGLLHNLQTFYRKEIGQHVQFN